MQSVASMSGDVRGSGAGQEGKMKEVNLIKGALTTSGPSDNGEDSATLIHNKQKIGRAKPVQEYRRKVPFGGPEVEQQAQSEVKVMPDPGSSNGPLKNGVGSNEGKAPVEAHDNQAVPKDKDTEVKIFLHSAFQAMEATSTLDRSKHTVIDLQQNRKAMEELNTNSSKVATNDRSELSNINPGKENMSQMDAAEVIREELVLPSVTETLLACAGDRPRQSDEDNDDTTGAGMVA
ncbi:hypothetical protein K1719_032716 [Acacia pycnantha]|nr:hypothetical protein K1719_032716 [Acacia pycnantha]